jgi:GntR family transcriptional regulator
VKEGARKLLLKGEREKFLAEDWPRISETIQRLGLTREELLEAGNGRGASALPRASGAPPEKKGDR